MQDCRHTFNSLFYIVLIEVQCDTPGVPTNGYIQGTGPYKAGDVVQYNCNPDYMMDGQPIVACQDNGRWSGPIPKCKFSSTYLQYHIEKTWNIKKL